MLKEFKQFILRGNVIDLAVAVVIGAAFNNVIHSIVNDFVTPLVGAIYKQKQFQNSSFHFHGSVFNYGDFVNNIVTFLVIAVIVFFLVVQPINKLIALSNRRKSPEEPGTKKCPYCLSDVNIKATRCSFCTSKLPATKK